MAIQTQGISGVVDEVEANTRARRVTQRPLDVGALGAYQLAIDNGATVMTAGLAAGSEIYQFRWTATPTICLLRAVRISMGTVIAFVAGRMVFDIVTARGWSAAGTGGTTATVTTNNAKKRTTFASSQFSTTGEIRYSQTVTLAAGTKTLDTQAFGNIATGAPTTIGPVLTKATLWERTSGEEYPFAFVQNEGFVIRATVPGTGTWLYSVEVEWSEVATY